MNIKSSYKYQMDDCVKSLVIFYIVILVISLMVMSQASTLGWLGIGKTTVSGLDFASVIFCFILGLNTFKENFGMLMQNGMSRKSVFIGKLLMAASVALIMALVDKALLEWMKAVTGGSENVTVTSLFEQIFPLKGAFGHVTQVTYNFVLYLVATLAGYFTTIMFYRLNRLGKVLVGAGVPVLLLIVYPIVDQSLNWRISTAVSRFTDWAFGLTAAQPWASVLSYAVITAAFTLFAWLLMRRAVVRK